MRPASTRLTCWPGSSPRAARPAPGARPGEPGRGRRRRLARGGAGGGGAPPGWRPSSPCTWNARSPCCRRAACSTAPTWRRRRTWCGERQQALAALAAGRRRRRRGGGPARALPAARAAAGAAAAGGRRRAALRRRRRAARGARLRARGTGARARRVRRARRHRRRVSGARRAAAHRFLGRPGGVAAHVLGLLPAHDRAACSGARCSPPSRRTRRAGVPGRRAPGARRVGADEGRRGGPPDDLYAPCGRARPGGAGRPLRERAPSCIAAA